MLISICHTQGANLLVHKWDGDSDVIFTEYKKISIEKSSAVDTCFFQRVLVLNFLFGLTIAQFLIDGG